MPLVSVVVPLYNKAATVIRTLDSIAAQTFTDFEVLAINDGSPANDAELARAHPDPRIRVIDQPNAGPGAARNRGIREAQGEWVAFLDADDVWLPDYLSSQFALCETNPFATVVACGYNEYPQAQSTEALWRSRGLRDGAFRLTPETPALEAVHLLAFLSPCTTMARRDVLLQYGGFYEHNCRYAEDAWLWLQVLLNEPLALRLEPHVNVHFEASGLSNNRARQSPIEPFLEHPESIEAASPAELRPLLAQMLAIRAFKRACVYGYWGRWREAGPLRRRFTTPGVWRLPYYFPALAAGTPLAALAGAVLRSLRR